MGDPRITAHNRALVEAMKIVDVEEVRRRVGLGPEPLDGQVEFQVNFNRPAMIGGEEKVWNIKFDGADHAVKDIDCRVPCCTRFRKDGPQPRAGLFGHAHQVTIIDDIAVIE